MVPAVSPTRRVLEDLARPIPQAPIESIRDLLRGPTRAAFLATVLGHRLDPTLASVLEAAGDPIPSELAATLGADRVVRLSVRSVLASLTRELDQGAIEWVVLKGPSVAEHMARPELRAFSDLDLLVGAGQFGQALDILRAAGAVELNRNWEPYLRHRVGEVPLVCRGITIDLHWHLIGLATTRKTMVLPPAPMLERRRRVPMGDADVWTLDAADQMSHIAVHAALSGGTRLDQLRDLAVLASADPPEWDEFIDRAGNAGIARLVAQPLDRARSVLDAEVPQAVVEQLGGVAVRARRGVDARFPARLRGFPVVALRDRPNDLVRALWHRARQSALDSIGKGPSWDFTDESGVLYFDRPSGGLGARAEFVAGVGRWGAEERVRGRAPSHAERRRQDS